MTIIFTVILSYFVIRALILLASWVEGRSYRRFVTWMAAVREHANTQGGTPIDEDEDGYFIALHAAGLTPEQAYARRIH